MRIEQKDGPDIDHKAGVIPLSIKAISEDGEFEGYASTFGNVDRGMDRVMPGAFRASLKEKKLPAIKMLRDHDTRKIVGQWLDLSEDDRGLKARGRLFVKEGESVPLAAETHTLMRAQALDAMSIGYRTIKAKWDEDTGVRELHELELWEISIVTFPMNEMATIDAVKNDLTERDIERILREGGAPVNFAKLVALHGFAEAKKRLSDRRDGGAGSIAEMIRKANEDLKGI